MEGDLSELYQEIILDHNKNPRNARTIPHPTHTAAGHNPLCGDDVTVYAQIEDGYVVDVSFIGEGCAISQASASLMTQAVKGKSVQQVYQAVAQMRDLITAEQEPAIDLEALGDLAALAGVRRFPVRIKCATLSWHALEAALAGDSAISTEQEE